MNDTFEVVDLCSSSAESTPEAKRVLSRVKSEKGDQIPGGLLELPVTVTRSSLQVICNALLSNKDHVPYSFYVNDVELTDSLKDIVGEDTNVSEDVIEIIYQPQAIFKVKTVTRCTGSIQGHKEAMLSVAFSPDGTQVASGSGDTTVRVWDINTQTPQYTYEGHKHWVLCISWSPCGTKLASGCKNGTVLLWDPKTGKQIGKASTAHTLWVTSLAWEPYHKNRRCQYLASGAKDCIIKIWDTIQGRCAKVLSGHKKSVTCIKWGGRGLIYSASQDRTVKVWRAEDGTLCRTLFGHAHWVNTLALNVDYVLRTGYFNLGIKNGNSASRVEQASKCYEAMGEEYLVSGSDDYTMYLWKPETTKQYIARLTGHQNIINDVKFSPDGRLIASASFDRSIKIWNGYLGKYIATLRGHVNSVYSIAWSADSRLLVSGSSDSTLKVWCIATKSLLRDLPGHADEVYTVDWSPDGFHVASGGKDKVLRLWRH